MKKKQVQNQAQDGRSMVEMLGVLAIIGVISLGGIAGYRMAMNRYQANQIANEINLMRTDAKIKIAQGVEKLLLGAPYDGEGGHLNFGSNYGVEIVYPVIISGEEVEEGGEEGYSFTLSGISAGVCKPLTTLLWSMNDTASLKVNEDYYDEAGGNECGQDENKIEVAFSTKDLGGISGGSGEEPGQGDAPQECDPSDPSTCEGECTESGCEPCSGDTPYWNGNVCVGCKGGTWDNDAKTCICTSEEQTWNMATGECVCSDTYNRKHWDSNTSRCISCESNEVWNEVDGQCEVPEAECRTNADCNKNNKNGYFCLIRSDNDCMEFEDGDSHNSGTCKLVSSYLKKKAKIGGTTYYRSTNNMSWWSACRFCAARKGVDDARCKSDTSGTTGTTEEPEFMAGYEMLQCADPIYVDNQKTGYCHERKAGNTNYYDDNTAERVKDLREMYGCGREDTSTSCNYYLWLRDSYDSCSAYTVSLTAGRVTNYFRNQYFNALCE